MLLVYLDERGEGALIDGVDRVPDRPARRRSAADPRGGSRHDRSRLSSALRRELERELVRGLGPRRRRALIERLRGNAEARAVWDRANTAVRVLEDRSVSRSEIDQVERWSFEDLVDDGVVTASAPGRAATARRWTWLGAALTSLATAASVAWWIGVGPEPDVEPPPTVPCRTTLGSRPAAHTTSSGRSRSSRSAVSRLGRPGIAAARATSCSGSRPGSGPRISTPELAAKLGAAPVSLSVFGIAEDGSVRYYLPTPSDPSLPSLALSSRWQPLPLSIRLAVHHDPGRVRVFALASPASPTVADIDRLAAALRDSPRADVDDPPWHLRLDRAASSAGLLRDLCDDLDRCSSAETELAITPTRWRGPHDHARPPARSLSRSCSPARSRCSARGRPSPSRPEGPLPLASAELEADSTARFALVIGSNETTQQGPSPAAFRRRRRRTDRRAVARARGRGRAADRVRSGQPGPVPRSGQARRAAERGQARSAPGPGCAARWRPRPPTVARSN